LLSAQDLSLASSRGGQVRDFGDDLQDHDRLYLLCIAMISSSLGSYIAGRPRSRWDGLERDEVYFRDTAHGFVAWAAR
jgi:hypothetical protein